MEGDLVITSFDLCYTISVVASDGVCQLCDSVRQQMLVSCQMNVGICVTWYGFRVLSTHAV